MVLTLQLVGLILCLLHGAEAWRSLMPSVRLQTLSRTQPQRSRTAYLQRKQALFQSSSGNEIMDVSEVTPGAESFKFESNVARVMDIIINSLYSNKDVFLRELVSNAADACDKKRFLVASGAKEASSLRIRVYPNRKEQTLTIEDTGIGMNKEDLINNLGKIAESGTKNLLEKMSQKEKEEMNLIGQFGVGFYSGFLVADKITVITKGSSGEQLRWEATSDALSTYSISKDLLSEPIEDTGTKVILKLKPDNDQYLDELNLKGLLEKYSEFIQIPIELQRNVSRPEQVPDESLPPEADGTIPTKTVMKRVLEWTVVNDKKPLWMRRPKDCAPKDYAEFYKQTFKAFDTPLAHSHFSLEGNVDFKALLFVPSEIPYELSRDMFANAARQMRLYVKRVFINDKFEDLLPRWLIFLRGVVDSNDLPLNVGREILQQSRTLKLIKTRLVKKAIDMFTEIANRNTTADYSKFWKNYGKYLKLGVIEEEKLRDDLVPLLRFYSSKDSGNLETLTSLPEYVSRMPLDQNYIYYASGETKAQAAMSPAIEKLKKKGYEVIYISEALDEMCLQYVERFANKQIVDAAKELPNTETNEEKKEKEQKNEALGPLRNWMKQVLGDRITKVEASTRLVDSPATLIQSEYGVSPNMQRYLKAQNIAENDDKASINRIFNQAVLELNPDHPVIQNLKELHEQDPQSAQGKALVELLFNTAALAAGYVLDNSVEYSQQVVKMLTQMVEKNKQPAGGSGGGSSEGEVQVEQV